MKLLLSKALDLLFLVLLSFSTIYSQQINIPVNPDNYIPQIPKHTDTPPYSFTRTDFTITLRDGVLIDAVKFIPVGTVPSGGWPTVILVHGYGNDKSILVPSCQSQASNGYYAMTFSMRGQGNSGGLSNLMSRTEAQDLIEIVNWVKGDASHGSNPNRIYITGGSQGGIIPFMAACIGQTSSGSLNVKTIISSLAAPNFASNWIENGSIKMTFLWTISYTSANARYTPQVNSMRSWLYANNKEKWDSLAYWTPVNRDYMNLVSTCTTPVIVDGSWQDKFFNGSGILEATSHLQSPFRMYLGAVNGHGGDPSPAEDQWHGGFIYSWISYWVLGIQNGVLNSPKYEYASTTYPTTNSYWSFIHGSSATWPPQNTTDLKLYFNNGNKLLTAPNPVPGEKATLVNAVSGGLTMLQAVNYGFTGSTFNSKFTKNTLNFDSNPLAADYKLMDVPKINLEYSSTAGPFTQYNFQIYEVKPGGEQKLVNRINYTDRNYAANSVKTILFKGQAHSHIFKAGNKIRITVTNLDTSPDDALFMETNPFVLPVLINSSNHIHLTVNSYINLPGKYMSPLSAENNTTSAVDYKLNQNYPNPFNPSTSISFNIAEAGFVTLKIYDVTGKEVKTLVNEMKTAGTHSVVFDAQSFASGVYFYKIEANDFSYIKKMILVK
ncbi:MAG: T9SS C-terminal target domain-containing protein [Ignavibacteriae bacterium]|nr:MAG: T9SS C-terminal target domain-containing protein [Ignavibacteriota bacterium]